MRENKHMRERKGREGQTVIERSKGKACCNAALGGVDLVQGGDGSVEGRGGGAAVGGSVVDGGSLPLDKRKVLLQCCQRLLGVGHCSAQFCRNDAFHCLKKSKKEGKGVSQEQLLLSRNKKETMTSS